ncbi:uncharacterized protein V1510DRAFT_234081 [Dipodascopsis tothii]|uniref:uncharacterized protein n=1 Tax=Dipodascopsis tothii TaxID=44089 RepID=UPI0034CD2B02
MSSSRYTSTLHQRDARTQLFETRAGSPGYGYSEDKSAPFRSATPNARGQYSDTVMSGLESQNDNELEGLTARVRMLKTITTKIGDEVRDSTKLMTTLETGFESTQVRLKGTYKRMMVMADRSGIPFKYWLMFFGFVFFMFWLVRWL